MCGHSGCTGSPSGPIGIVSAGTVSAGTVSGGIVSAGTVSAGIVSAGTVSAGRESIVIGSTCAEASFLPGKLPGAADAMSHMEIRVRNMCRRDFNRCQVLIGVIYEFTRLHYHRVSVRTDANAKLQKIPTICKCTYQDLPITAKTANNMCKNKSIPHFFYDVNPSRNRQALTGIWWNAMVRAP